jgi:putative transposase
LISPDPQVSVRHQCELLELCRSSYYYQCCPETEENLALMRRLDELHLEHPVYGSRKLTVLLRQAGLALNRKRVVRLLRLMGIEAIYAKPRTSLPEPGHQIYPYLLRDLAVTGPDQVWCLDITYVPMAAGFMYLVAVMDWWSRYVLGWRLSNTMEAAFCVDAWEAALRVGRQAPLISNTDQGSQFTSPLFIDAVESAGVDVSMDGRGRWLDNRFIERLWRSVKYEDIYLQDYGDGLAAGRGLGRWFDGYNQERPHQALDYATPAQVYFDPGAHGAQPAQWKRCSPKDHDRPERLEIRPPAAVRLGTLRKGRGRTGRVTHGSFSLFQRVLKRRMNDRQTKIQMTADRQSPSYFLRSVV